MDNGKIDRVLGIYSKLMGGALVNKAEEARNYGVNERTIQRDIDDIRNHLEAGAETTERKMGFIQYRQRSLGKASICGCGVKEMPLRF